MDLPLLMLCIFAAGAVVGVLMGGIRRRPAGFEHELAALRAENSRLVEENNMLRAESRLGAFPDGPDGGVL